MSVFVVMICGTNTQADTVRQHGATFIFHKIYDSRAFSIIMR